MIRTGNMEINRMLDSYDKTHKTNKHMAETELAMMQTLAAIKCRNKGG
jgi:hypothetical protein